MTHTINVNGKLINFDTPVVMGILNVTPDSFFDGGRYNTNDSIKARAEQILSEGAGIIDLGAYSSRPGADDVSPDEEWRRLDNALEIIGRHFPEAIVSVDTFRADVARKCVQQGGAAIINDIAGGEMDADMFRTVAELHVPYILMHMKGTPQDMQIAPSYDNMMDEMMDYFGQKVLELRRLGVADIILDPGFGFGKTLEHNYQLMREMDKFAIFDMPILVGISRKSMIYRLLGSSPKESLNGTTVLNTLALNKGASILRVHDVKEAVECVKIHTAYNNL